MLTEVIGILLQGLLYLNNSIVSVDDITNTDSGSLQCITNSSQCCNNNDGNWYSLSGVAIHGYDVTRGSGVVRLKRINDTPQTGLFRCEIHVPTHSLTYNFYVGLYHLGNGNYCLYIAVHKLIIVNSFSHDNINLHMQVHQISLACHMITNFRH